MSQGTRVAVFLDRDGTVIEQKEYLADPDGVVLLPGATSALASLEAAGYAVVVVTNQSGIARGLYGDAEYRAVAERLNRILADAGTPVDGTYYCPHHPDWSGPCECRKPGTGMYRQAASDLGLDLAASWYVGDKLADVVPAVELGGRGILVRTGYGREHESDLPKGMIAVDDLAAAARHILGVDDSEPR